MNLILLMAKLVKQLNRANHWFLKYLQKNSMMCCGKDVYIGKGCVFTECSISIGNHVYIGAYSVFQATHSKIIIGDNIMFGPSEHIHGGNHRIDVVGKYMIDVKEKRYEDDQDIVIKNDVWIGANVMILKGVTIGEGSVIGAGTVVNQDVPPYTVVVGSLPRKSWQRWDQETIKEHRAKVLASIKEKEN